mgnify:CR=1 FL=1
MIFSTLGNSDYLIHHPSQVELYAVTREQLELLSKGSESDWKGRWQNAFSIFITCLINIIALGWNTESASFRLNFAIGIIALGIGVICLIFYICDKLKQRSRLNEILKQPIQQSKNIEEAL